MRHLFPPTLREKNSQMAKVEKLNIGLAHVNDITEGLVYNNVCSKDAVSAYAQIKESKNGSMSANTL